MRNISSSIAEILGTQGIIQEDDVDKCRYGLEVFISSSLEALSILLISVFVGNFFETLLFFSAFIPLRIYAGGYHADTRLRCYLVSLAVYGLFTIVIKVLPTDLYRMVNMIEVLFTLGVVIISSPVIHHRKGVNDIEIQHYRKRSIQICIVQAVIILALIIFLRENRFVTAFALGQIAESLSMLAAIVKDRITDHK